MVFDIINLLEGTPGHMSGITTNLGTFSCFAHLTTTKNVYISNCVLNVLNIDQATERAGSENNKGAESAQALNNLFIT